VTVRGQAKFVVMSREQYAHLRECELEAALAESKADLDAGRFVKESVEQHLKAPRQAGGVNGVGSSYLPSSTTAAPRGFSNANRTPPGNTPKRSNCWKPIRTTRHCGLHALKGRLSGLHSVSINLSYRITLEMVITKSRSCRSMSGPRHVY